METTEITIRINLEQREFEVKGDAKYIDDNFGAYIKDYLDIIKSTSQDNIKQNEGNPISAERKRSSSTEIVSKVPDSFGEYLNKFPKTINNVDKILIAGFYIQSISENNCFLVAEASNLLVEQGVKLSNSSVFNKSNVSTKRAFKVSGKNFRVSDIGVEYIKTLLQ